MADLIGLTSVPEICFGPSRPSVVLESGQVWMDQGLPTREGAARLAHLVSHLDRPPYRRGTDCLEHAIAAETDALQKELLWRLELSVHTPFWEYEFEDAWRSGGQKSQVIRSYIEGHPAGGGGIAPIIQDYEERCLLPSPD